MLVLAGAARSLRSVMESDGITRYRLRDCGGLTPSVSNARNVTRNSLRFGERYNSLMPLNVIKARLNSLRKNLPTGDVEQSEVETFNAMADELEEELQDPEVGHFKVKSTDVKQIWRRVRNQGRKLSDDKYCNNRVFKKQVDGLWEYLVDSHRIDSGMEDTPKTSHSGDMHFHAPVTGSVIQQGSHNTATVKYQNEVGKVLDEIRPVMNAAKLTAEAKEELRAEVETVEAQVKSPKPKHMIIRESLQSARHILEHAFGAGMGHAYFPFPIEFQKHHH